MGSPKTQTVGGGQAAPVANSWNNFLQGQMWQQPGVQSMPQTMAGGMQPQNNMPRPPGMQDSVWNQLQQGMAAQQNAMNGSMGQGGTPGQFQNALQGMMNPNYGNMIQNNPFLQGAQGYNPMAQLPNAPNFGYPGMQGQGQQMNAQGQGMQGLNIPPEQAALFGMSHAGTGGFNMQNAGGNPLAQPNIPNAQQGYNPAQAATLDPNSFVNSLGGGQGGLDLLKGYGIDIKSLLGGGNQGSPGGLPTFTPSTLLDYSNDPSFKAIQDVANRQKMNDVANLRARYGLQGNTASSGASLAEAQYNAEANPRLIASLGGLGREIQGLDLQRQQMDMQGRIAAGNAAAGYGAGQSADQSRNLGNILQFIQGIQGQNVGAAAGLAGQNLGNQQSANNLNANNQLSALGMDANNALNLFGQNSQNALNLFGQQSSNALNNQGQANNWMQTLFGGGLNLQGLGQQGQLAGLQGLFNSYNQANQLGTPQAQTVQNPSQISQILGMASSFLPLIPGMQPLAMGSQFMQNAMNRPTMAPPQVQPLGPNYTPNFGIGNQRRP